MDHLFAFIAIASALCLGFAVLAGVADQLLNEKEDDND